MDGDMVIKLTMADMSRNATVLYELLHLLTIEEQQSKLGKVLYYNWLIPYILMAAYIYQMYVSTMNMISIRPLIDVFRSWRLPCR